MVTDKPANADVEINHADNDNNVMEAQARMTLNNNPVNNGQRYDESFLIKNVNDGIAYPPLR